MRRGGDVDTGMETRNLADLYELSALVWEAVAADECPAQVDGSGAALTAELSAPSAGPPPRHVYRLEVRSAVALATVEPGSATRWRF